MHGEKDSGCQDPYQTRYHQAGLSARSVLVSDHLPHPREVRLPRLPDPTQQISRHPNGDLEPSYWDRYAGG